MSSTYNRSMAIQWLTGLLIALVFLINITTQYGLTKEGDLRIGGMFLIHQSCKCESALSQQCAIFPKGLFLAEAMVFAVRLVNQQYILPFNITLGFNIRDTCDTLSTSVNNALIFASQRKIQLTQADRNLTLDKQMKSSLIGVIGAGNSELSLAVNNVLSVYDIPQVGYASSATFLNDKNRYKTFLRVLPPDSLQAKALAQLIAHFKWNFISLVSSDAQYASALRQAFREEARRLDICLSNDVLLSDTSPSIDYIRHQLQRIKKTNNSRIIVLFTSETITKQIVKVAEEQRLTGHIWIASDSWSNAFKLFQQRLSILRGGLGIMFQYRPVEGFRKYLQRQIDQSEEVIQKDPWLRDLLNALKSEDLDTILGSHNAQDEKAFRSKFARVDYVMNSVFLLSHSIREFCFQLKFHSNSTASEKKAKCLGKIVPRDLLRFIFNKTIRGFSGNITIDENGEPNDCQYEFYNMQEIKGELNYVKIGHYDSKTMLLDVNDSSVDFGHGAGLIPESKCSRLCYPGYYVIRKNIRCCWECKRCPTNEVSNVTMATSCVACRKDHVANSNRSQCVYVELRYLSWTNPWAIVIVIFTLLGFLLTCFIAIVFIKYRHSPVVRASCFEISIVLLLSMAMGFLLPFLQIGKQTSELCKVSAFLFAVIFTLILSLTLAKINRTVLILNNRLESKMLHARILLSRRAHFSSVAFLTIIQVSICTSWLYLDPPHEMITTKASPRNPSRYLHCTNYSSYWFLISSGFLILLSVLCTILAFRSRNFPENYNHAKFVSLAMFTFDTVWITFMCAFYGKNEPGFHRPVIHMYAIMFSNLLLLMLIFAPKVYVIFFKPELNNTRTFREMNFQHILHGAARASRNYSLGSIQGHGNVYLMDCEENNKGVQTPRVYTRDAQTQADLKKEISSHRTSFIQRLLRIGSRQRGVPFFKRGYSESDTPRQFKPIDVSGPSHSSPYPLHSDSQFIKGDLDKVNEHDGVQIDNISEGNTLITNNSNNDNNSDIENEDDNDDSIFETRS